MDVMITAPGTLLVWGDKDFKPTYEKNNLVSECTLKLTN